MPRHRSPADICCASGSVASSRPPKSGWTCHETARRGTEPFVSSCRPRHVRADLPGAYPAARSSPRSVAPARLVERAGSARPVISYDEVDRILNGGAELARAELAFYDDNPAARALTGSIHEHDSAARADPILERLRRDLGLEQSRGRPPHADGRRRGRSVLRRVFGSFTTNATSALPTPWLGAANSFSGRATRGSVPNPGSYVGGWRGRSRAPGESVVRHRVVGGRPLRRELPRPRRGSRSSIGHCGAARAGSALAVRRGRVSLPAELGTIVDLRSRPRKRRQARRTGAVD